MKSKMIVRVSLLAVSGLGLLIILALVELPNTYLWRAISNFGHIPIFGSFSLVIFGLSVNILGNHVQRRWSHYMIALAITMVVGILSEYSQIAGPRDADIRDLIRDFGGAVSFLCFFMFYDSELATQMRGRIRKIRLAALMVALITMLVGVAPVGYWAAASWHRNRAFPAICEFESIWEKPYRETRDAELAVVAPPANWIGSPGNRVARLTFRPALYSEFIVLETCPDWSAFDRFAFEIYSELDSAVSVSMRLEDAHHNSEDDDRFGLRIRVAPGLNQVVIPLIDIRQAPVAREMDMTAIRTFSLFVHQSPDTLALYLDNFRLEEDHRIGQ